MSEAWSLTAFYHTVVDVRDLDRSLAFYTQLGFEILEDRRDVVWPDFVARNFGMRRAQGRGVLLGLPDDPGGTMLDLIQWVDPPYPAPDPDIPEDLRIPRIIAFRVQNVQAAYDDLLAKGVPITNAFTGPFEALGVRGVFCCKDPDGTIVEFIELDPGLRHSQARKALPAQD